MQKVPVHRVGERLWAGLLSSPESKSLNWGAYTESRSYSTRAILPFRRRGNCASTHSRGVARNRPVAQAVGSVHVKSLRQAAASVLADLSITTKGKRNGYQVTYVVRTRGSSEVGEDENNHATTGCGKQAPWFVPGLQAAPTLLPLTMPSMGRGAYKLGEKQTTGALTVPQFARATRLNAAA